MTGEARFCTPAETREAVDWAVAHGARALVEPQSGEGGSRWAWVTIEDAPWPATG